MTAASGHGDRMTAQLVELAELLQGCAREVQALLMFALIERARSTGAEPSRKAVQLLRLLNKLAQQPRDAKALTPQVRITPAAVEPLTVREAAERMGCSTQWVRHELNAGRLAGRKSGGVWIVQDARLSDSQAA